MFLIAAALALATGILFVPGDSFARRAGGFAAAHGPVFGFAGHRAFRPALVHRAPARLGWHLRRHHHRFGGRDRDGASAVYGGSPGWYPSGITGTVPEGPAVYPPPLIPPPPTERVGCFAKSYDVPAEFGGVARVVVTRC